MSQFPGVGFRETFRSVSVERFAKFRLISIADNFGKFWSFSAISVVKFFEFFG